MSQLSNRVIRVALVQLGFSQSLEENLARVESAIREAAASGANVILAPELFQGWYFCQTEQEAYFDLAWPADQHPAIRHMQQISRELGVVLPVSFFEREGNQYYNSLAMVDADGSVLGTYRKSHIPDGPGYEEKFYFRPGNTGFRVWQTRFGCLGVGVCWDQWFPEAARAMVLMGAEILFYPTAIGSEPEEPDLDTRKMWTRVMQGHAVANVVPVVAANRTGDEAGQAFYGNSFICDHQGELVHQMGDSETGVIAAEFDLAKIRRARAGMGFFRDRRPELYGSLCQSV